MKFTIKNRYTDEIIVEDEAKSMKEFVEKNKSDLQRADLRRADLWGADLQRADLREADLQRADLRGADLQRAEIKITQKEELLRSIRVIIKE